jgi:hypothetical protein
LRAAREGIAEADRPGDAPGRHHALDELHREVHGEAFGHRQQIADLGGDDVLDRRAIDHLSENVGKVLQDDDGLGAGIDELVLELARTIEGVRVHHGVAGAQRAEHGDRILQQIGHHQRDAGAAFELQGGLQIGGKIARQAIELGVGDRRTHVDEGRAAHEFLDAAVEHLADRAELVDVHCGRDALGIGFQPDRLHGTVLPLAARRQTDRALLSSAIVLAVHSARSQSASSAPPFQRATTKLGKHLAPRIAQAARLSGAERRHPAISPFVIRIMPGRWCAATALARFPAFFSPPQARVGPPHRHPDAAGGDVARGLA